MSIKLPKLIAIDHDDYHAEFVGKTADGKQFFLTTPFVPATPTDTGNEFVALYLLNCSGRKNSLLLWRIPQRLGRNSLHRICINPDPTYVPAASHKTLSPNGQTASSQTGDS